MGELGMATRVLICDDHPVFRGGLAAALTEEPDFELVGEVGSLAELRTWMADRGTTAGADLVLLDIDLPDGSGLDAVAEVARVSPVIMISAHDEPNLIRRAMQDGAVGYIRKDTEPLDLLRLIRRGAEGKTALSGDMALRMADSLRRDPEERAFDEAIASLSPRQREVIALIADGKSNREIADRLCIGEGTVKNYVTKILEVVGVTDRTKLAILLVRRQMAR
jgi:RNA polymerase sigma factor (sigma-70 family)